MQEKPESDTKAELQKWIKNQLDSGVRELINTGHFDSLTVEAKPAWIFPFGLMIGKIRQQDRRDDFDWFICGEFPTERAHSSIASTPREAARHFALKWQLEAKRLEDSGSGSDIRDLVQRAQSLYELVEQDGLWESNEGGQSTISAK